MNVHRTAIGTALAVSILILAGGPTSLAQQAVTKQVAKPKPVALPPKPAEPSYANAQPDQPVVHIEMVVLELHKDGQATLRDTIREHFPGVDATQFAVELGDVTSEKRSRFVRSTTEFATVLSRPTVLTREGTEATVQVGKQVAFPSVNGSEEPQTVEVGLKIACTPHAQENGKKLHLDLNVSYSELDPSRSVAAKGTHVPAINERYVSTTLEVDSGSTIGLTGPKGKGELFVILTPTLNPSPAVVNPLKPRPGAATPPSPGHPLPPAAPPAPPAPAVAVIPAAPATVASRPTADQAVTPIPDGLAGDFKRLQRALEAAAPEAETSISLKGKEIQVQAIVPSPAQAGGVARALDEFDAVEIKSIRVLRDRDDTRIEAVGEIKQAAHQIGHEARSPEAYQNSFVKRYTKLATGYRPKDEDSPRARFSRLESLLKELYPHEDLQPRLLNTSVLLRGRVSEKAIPTIVRIAEDFAPSVINDLIAVEHPIRQRVVAVRPSPDSGLREEMRALRNDVQALHADVRRVIELLKTEDGKTNQGAKVHSATGAKKIGAAVVPPVKLRAAAAATEPSRITRATKATARWELTLAEALALARTNNHAEIADATETRIKQLFAEVAKDDAAQRWPVDVVYKQPVSEKQTPLRYVDKSAYSPMNRVNPTVAVYTPIGNRLTVALQRTRELKLDRMQGELRRLLGVAPNDQRKIILVTGDE